MPGSGCHYAAQPDLRVVESRWVVAGSPDNLLDRFLSLKNDAMCDWSESLASVCNLKPEYIYIYHRIIHRIIIMICLKSCMKKRM